MNRFEEKVHSSLKISFCKKTKKNWDFELFYFGATCLLYEVTTFETKKTITRRLNKAKGALMSIAQTGLDTHNDEPFQREMK